MPKTSDKEPEAMGNASHVAADVIDGSEGSSTGAFMRFKQWYGKNLISNLLLTAGIVLLLVAGGIWGWSRYRYYKQGRINEELASFVELPAEGDSGKEADETEGNKPPEVDWAGLKAINDEVVAWLQIPGTPINYPVYQANNNERYLRNSATGEWSVGGQLFCDYECTRPGMIDQVTLVYGHHLLDGTMFKAIAEMDNQENFDAVDTVWYVTEDKAWECEPLFLYYTQEDDQDARIYQWATEDEFRGVMAERLSRAVVQREDAEEALTRLRHALCLITCNYYDGYGRTILVCMPKEELTLPVDSTEDTDKKADDAAEEDTAKDADKDTDKK